VCLQVLATTAAIAITATVLHSSVTGAGAIILGGGMALSSTAVAMQVPQDGLASGILALALALILILILILNLIHPPDNFRAPQEGLAPGTVASTLILP